MKSPGNLLEELCGGANDTIILVAPFIKLGAFCRILKTIPDLAQLSVVTRWRPEEILAGVSDIRIWDYIKERANASLWLRPDLHAKYYRIDSKCLVGSANLTNLGLGWSSQSNLELLLELPPDNSIIVDFEPGLFAGCVLVDDDLYNKVSEIVALLTHKKILPKYTEEEKQIVGEVPLVVIPPKAWLPTLRRPELLYDVYSGQIDHLTSASREAALQDLAGLPIILGLPKEIFKKAIGTLLLQKPIVKQIDSKVLTPQRFGAVSRLLTSLPCAENPEFDAKMVWQTLMRWLRYFLPDRYQVSMPNYSEIFYRVDVTNDLS